MLMPSEKETPFETPSLVAMDTPADESAKVSEDTAAAPGGDGAEHGKSAEPSDDALVIDSSNALVEEAAAKADRIIAEAKAAADAATRQAKAMADETVAGAAMLAEAAYNDAQEKADGVLADAHAEAAAVRAEAQAAAKAVLAKAQEEADTLLAKAEADIKAYAAKVQEQARAVLAGGEAQAEQLRLKANAEAQSLLQTAKAEVQRVSEVRKAIGLRMYNRDHAELMGKFTSMSTVMMELNDIMRDMQDMLTRSHTKTVFDQLYDLYSLIADNRDSLSERSDYNENIDLQICCGNLEEFMYMITEYLAEYGIETVSTRSGAPFEGKYHNAVGNRSFHPAAARIAKSLRCGFVWDDVVLIKEKVVVC